MIRLLLVLFVLSMSLQSFADPCRPSAPYENLEKTVSKTAGDLYNRFEASDVGKLAYELLSQDDYHYFTQHYFFGSTPLDEIQTQVLRKTEKYSKDERCVKDVRQTVIYMITWCTENNNNWAKTRYAELKPKNFMSEGCGLTHNTQTTSSNALR